MWMCWGCIAQTGAADGSYYATFKASIVDSCEMTIATGISSEGNLQLHTPSNNTETTLEIIKRPSACLQNYHDNSFLFGAVI